MKIAVISDIHSNLEAISSVVADSRGRADGYFCLGDVVGYGADPDAAIEVLGGLNLLGCISGNHDNAVLTGDFSRFRRDYGVAAIRWTRDNVSEKSIAFLKSHSPHGGFENFGFTAFHGGPDDNLWQYIYPDSPVLMYYRAFASYGQKTVFVGHSHLQFAFDLEDITVINPGSVGQARNGVPMAHYAIYDTENRGIEFRKVGYDIGPAAEKILKAGLHPFLASRLYEGI